VIKCTDMPSKVALPHPRGGSHGHCR
jgi:hypothetical protein